MTYLDAAALGIPRSFNAATYFVDRHVTEGRGDAVAIECGDERVTYADVRDRVSRTGAALRDRLGVRPEERVLLLLHDGPAFAYSFFGAIKIGAVAVPVNTLWKAADYRYVLEDTRARVLIVSEELLPQFEQTDPDDRHWLEHVVVVGPGEVPGGYESFADLLDGAASQLQPAATGRDDAAFWLYTSGSTGAPKACVHLHHDMVMCAELAAGRVLGIRADDRCFSAAKLFFAYGLGNALYFPFSVGATSVLWPGRPTAADVYAAIERYRPTMFFSVPTGFGMMLAHQRDGGRDFDLSSVRTVVSAGEALPIALFERFKQRFSLEILDGIGSTELLQVFISNRPGAVRPGSSGQPVPGYEAKLLDDDGAPVGEGEIGNLWVRGDSACACYWNQHEKTKQTFVGEWTRTGDKYRCDGDGYYWYAGRADDMLKVGGMWVSPLDVENALMSHPVVQECAVVGREDHDRLLKPMAFVVVKAGVDSSPALGLELQQYVRERIPEYKRPRWVTFLPELPKTPTGKIQRFRLRDLAVSAAEDRR